MAASTTSSLPNNSKKKNMILPPPADLGITPDNYAYCYCEENVRRAIVKILGKASSLKTKSTLVEEEKEDAVGVSTVETKIEPFAVFCSSYNQPEPAVIFPGSWLPFSSVTLVVDAQKKSTISWDYHVFIVIRVSTITTTTIKKTDESDEKKKQVEEDQNQTKTNDTRTTTAIEHQHFVADYDSGLCNKPGKKGTVQNLIPLEQYCDITFSKTLKSTARLRVVSGMEYWDKFRSTRAHMLPPPMLKNWLKDKSRRNMPAPAEWLMQKPHPNDAATCGDNDGVDLAHFINMSEKVSIAPGVVLTVDDFRAGKW